MTPRSWFGGTSAVLRHELRQYLATPLTYVFIASFSILLHVATFLVADFFNSDDASLNLLITFLPWVSLVLIPALAMRAWVGDVGDRTLELTLSLPLTAGTIVAGKFMAGTVVLLMALASTAAFPATIIYLGVPDPGVLASGYLSAVLLVVTCHAICLFGAVLVHDQVNAFLVSLFLLLALMLLGWDVAAQLMGEAIPPGFAAALTALSPKIWLDRIAVGYIEAVSLLFFFLLTVGALVLCAWALTLRRHNTSWGVAAPIAAGLVFLFAGLPLALKSAERFTTGIDLTYEREFTLDESMHAILEDIPEGTEIILYWSASEASVPVAIKSHARRVRDRLKLMAAHSQGKLTFREFDPHPDSDVEFTALEEGIRRVPMTSGDSFYFGLTAVQGGRTGRIPYLDQRRESLLNYDLAVILSGIARERTPRIGLVSPLVAPTATKTGHPGLSILDELRQAYDLAIVPHFADALPDGLDALLVVQSTILKPSMLYAIDQHVMRGGGLIVLVDPHMRSDRASNETTLKPSENIDDISDLLLAWGLRYDGQVAGDSSVATQVRDSSGRRISYPYWLRLRPPRIEPVHPVTAGLEEILLPEAGSFGIAGEAQITPLINLTNASTRIRADFRTHTPEQLSNEFISGSQNRVIAAVLGGQITSAFNMPEEKSFLAQGRAPVFAVADADWIFDAFALLEVDGSGDVLERPMNDNFAFLLNMIEFATGDPRLISIRSKGKLHRPFERIERMLADAQAAHRESEQTLALRIARVEAKIAEAIAAAEVEHIDQLPTVVRTRINQIERGLRPLRRKLRTIRRAMRDEIEKLRLQLVAFNLLSGPLFIGIFLLFRNLLSKK